ncbi:BAR domain-containing protein [Trichophyton violaceum]|uniref:BAR domain-containing protein n=1 Tax=Trichophyton violaceum TaxID=34388 RepID=A0A178FBQ7_TRIVO|nr:BAR domain-containing protein [Trichophyton violaceum]
MNVNKKLGRLKQWAGERMGGEIKTNVSDDFKLLEMEMNLRQEGMERLNKAMAAYVRAISKRSEGEDKEKLFPIGNLGGVMVAHGEDFASNSEYGQCLTAFGRTNERISRIQEQYVAAATSSWLESLERSLNQLKEYQVARKKLENRRLAYDTSQAKMQKAKKEDFRVEEELRSQKVKYEEATEEVLRRMMDIKESEPECTADMSAFLDAQLNYHEKCREVLLQLKDEWPAGPTQQFNSYGCRSILTRSNTSFNDQMAGEDTYQSSSQQSGTSRSREPSRPGLGGRQPTFEGPTQLRTRRPSPSPAPALRTPLRTASDSISPATIGSSAAGIANARSQLRVISQGYNGGGGTNNNNTHNDGYYDSTTDDGASPIRNSPDQYYSSTSTSPLRTVPASGQVPTPASGSGSGTATPVKKPPPPPPPSRSKKPPPPPPPPKRSVSAYAV